MNPPSLRHAVVVCATLTALQVPAATSPLPEPFADPDLVFEESGGLAAVEAEHFHQQTLTEKRAWHLASPHHIPNVLPDGDPPHLEDASGGAHLEILPDTRRTHADPLVHGENFSAQPGEIGVLHYKVHFNNPGRYYVWVRAYSTGTEDNGLHVGLNGQWPESGQRLQWCDGKHSWRWESKQRTDREHCGEPHCIYLDIPTKGEHEIQFSMREDGFEFDKFLLTTNRNFALPEGVGPAPRARHGVLPPPWTARFPERKTILTVEGELGRNGVAPKLLTFPARGVSRSAAPPRPFSAALQTASPLRRLPALQPGRAQDHLGQPQAPSPHRHIDLALALSKS